jgi:hypothetical protein
MGGEANLQRLVLLALPRLYFNRPHQFNRLHFHSDHPIQIFRLTF